MYIHVYSYFAWLWSSRLLQPKVCISIGPDWALDLQQTSDPFGIPRPYGSDPGIGGRAFCLWISVGLSHAGTLHDSTILYWGDLVVRVLTCFKRLAGEAFRSLTFSKLSCCWFLGMWTIQSHTGKVPGKQIFPWASMAIGFHGQMTTRPCYSWRA